MAALGALLELGVDVHRHLRVGVADLAHHPLDVKVVGEEGDRDVGAPEGVRCGVRERREAARGVALARELGRVVHDRADALAVHAPAAGVLDQVRLGADVAAGAAQAVDVLDHRLGEVGRHLHLADAGLGLCVRDPEAGAVGVVEADVADADVAELARTYAASAEDLDNGAPADVLTDRLELLAVAVVADGCVGESELRGDLGALESGGVEFGYGGTRAVWIDGRGSRSREGDVLFVGGVDQRDELIGLEKCSRRFGNTDAHALSAGGVAIDQLILDRVVENRGERVQDAADRRWPEWESAAAAMVPNVGAGGELRAQPSRLGELVTLECEAQLAIDFVEAVARKEREQMNRQLPAIVRLRGGADRPLADHAVDLRLQPE